MEIHIVGSKIQFRNPQIGQPTRAVAEHYNGRRVVAIVDGRERMFRLTPADVAFEADEEAIVAAIEAQLPEPEPEPEE